jgi:tRNA pseudouridine38-40 synthase
MRIAFGLEYNGSNYHGWQRQDSLSTIQLHTENAITKIANHPVSVTCAGRTDIGVHAKEQVIHFDTESMRPMHAWVLGCNSNLPKDIVIKWAKIVPNDFHARFSAVARRYRYLIFNSRVRPAIFQNLVTWHIKKLDEKVMHEAAQYLVGEHDFSSFRGSECQSLTPMRNVHFIKVSRQNDLVILDIKANAFLHHMVRNIAGTLITIGQGDQKPDFAKSILECRERKSAPFSAAPDGLYLMKVYY